MVTVPFVKSHRKDVMNATNKEREKKSNCRSFQSIFLTVTRRELDNTGDMLIHIGMSLPNFISRVQKSEAVFLLYIYERGTFFDGRYIKEVTFLNKSGIRKSKGLELRAEHSPTKSCTNLPKFIVWTYLCAFRPCDILFGSLISRRRPG